jgi:hypothetical protein
VRYSVCLRNISVSVMFHCWRPWRGDRNIECESTSRHMILKTYMFTVAQRNQSALNLNHETEVCMKEKCTITYIYWVNESKWIQEYGVCIVKHKLILRTSLQYFLSPCEICTPICTKCVVVCSRISSEFHFASALLVWQRTVCSFGF